MKQYKATYNSASGNGVKYTTRYYYSACRAQAQLRDRIGGFNILGTVAGDAFDEDGKCTAGARQGGTVSVDEREA
tara:strand:- start:3876 stop:4100 length:225 start_codon:yes stop_codon:yes gene_type:complete